MTQWIIVRLSDYVASTLMTTAFKLSHCVVEWKRDPIMKSQTVSSLTQTNTLLPTGAHTNSPSYMCMHMCEHSLAMASMWWWWRRRWFVELWPEDCLAGTTIIIMELKQLNLFLFATWFPQQHHFSCQTLPVPQSRVTASLAKRHTSMHATQN